jgi:hypothetical protein
MHHTAVEETFSLNEGTDICSRNVDKLALSQMLSLSWWSNSSIPHDWQTKNFPEQVKEESLLQRSIEREKAILS